MYFLDSVEEDSGDDEICRLSSAAVLESPVSGAATASEVPQVETWRSRYDPSRPEAPVDYIKVQFRDGVYEKVDYKEDSTASEPDGAGD